MLSISEKSLIHSKKNVPEYNTYLFIFQEIFKFFCKKICGDNWKSKRTPVNSVLCIQYYKIRSELLVVQIKKYAFRVAKFIMMV